MSDYTLIGIILGAFAITAGFLGFLLGELHRHQREAAEQLERFHEQIDANTARIAVYGSVIDVIAEDYDPPPEPAERPRRKLPEGWSIHTGGAVLLGLLAGLGAWLRDHWRPVAATVTAAAAAAVIAGALSHHGTPPGHHNTTAPQRGPSPTATHHSPAPQQEQPTTAPRTPKAPNRTPPMVVVPIKTRRTTPAPSTGTPQPTAPPTPPAHALHPAPSLSPTPTPCPLGLTLVVLGNGLTLCI